MLLPPYLLFILKFSLKWKIGFNSRNNALPCFVPYSKFECFKIFYLRWIWRQTLAGFLGTMEFFLKIVQCKLSQNNNSTGNHFGHKILLTCIVKQNLNTKNYYNNTLINNRKITLYIILWSGESLFKLKKWFVMKILCLAY